MPALLKCSASLWSADLANLEAEIHRVDPLVDLYHLDVADGTYGHNLLFFPDLVAAVRRCTRRPLEVHLITLKPERWVDAFASAGADRIIFYPETTDDPGRLIGVLHDRGLQAGISLTVENPPSLIEAYLSQLEVVTVLGTGFDVKGVTDLAPGTCQKIAELVAHRRESRATFEIEADGAIRRHTVPKLREAGADLVVPGSLLFGGDAADMIHWLRSL